MIKTTRVHYRVILSSFFCIAGIIASDDPVVNTKEQWHNDAQRFFSREPSILRLIGAFARSNPMYIPCEGPEEPTGSIFEKSQIKRLFSLLPVKRPEIGRIHRSAKTDQLWSQRSESIIASILLTHNSSRGDTFVNETFTVTYSEFPDGGLRLLLHPKNIFMPYPITYFKPVNDELAQAGFPVSLTER